MAPFKLLFLHPLASKIESVMIKANQIQHTSGPFDGLFLVGDSFCGENLPEVKYPCYYMEGRALAVGAASSEANEASNERNKPEYLGKSGIKELSVNSKKLTVAVVSGQITKESPEIMAQFQNKVDILIACEWPRALSNSGAAPSLLDHIVRITEPRYIIVAGDSYYASSSLNWKSSRTSRFISLAPYKSKQKWFYAFSFDNEVDEIGEMSNPWEAQEEREAREAENSHKADAEEASEPTLENTRKRANDSEIAPSAAKQLKVDSSSCFFCLSNPNVETHMIVSIGTHTYVTIAKGPLTKPNKHVNKPIAGHVIIIPIDHVQSVNPVKRFGANGANSVVEESNAYINSLKKFYFTRFDMGLCCYEINTLKAVHYHQQVFPINLYFSISQFEKFLTSWSKRHKQQTLHFKKFQKSVDEYPGLDDFLGQSKEYISIELMIRNLDEDKSPGTYLFVALVDSDQYIDLQFPRRVLANYLKLGSRVSWRKCEESRAMEEYETETLKAMFEEYDKVGP